MNSLLKRSKGGFISRQQMMFNAINNIYYSLLFELKSEMNI